MVLTAGAETPLDDVAAALDQIQRGPLYLGNSPLSGKGRLGDVGLRTGDTVTVGRPGQGAARGGWPPGSAELAAVGGPSAGRRLLIGSRRQVVVGRGQGADLALNDDLVSPRHAQITISPGSPATATLADLGSPNGSLVDGQPVVGEVPLPAGALAEIGSSLLELRPSTAADADLHPAEDGLAFNRPPRLTTPPHEVHVAVPAEPARPDKPSFPWAQVIAPIVVSVAAAVLFRIPELLAFAALSPIMAVSTVLSNHRKQARSSAADKERYDAALAQARDRLTSAAAAERDDLRQRYPDPARLGAIATGPGRRLWERRPGDPDAFTLRIGLADRPASVILDGRPAGASSPVEVPTLVRAPVLLDLRAAGVAGVAGPAASVHGSARWLIGQLAGLISPRNLRIVLLTGGDSKEEWEWLRWLPHAAGGDDGPTALIGNDNFSREERIKGLMRLLDARSAALAQSRTARFDPSVVVVFDGIRGLRTMPGVPRILREGPPAGIYSICLDSDPTRLAAEGQAALEFDPGQPTAATLRVEGRMPVAGVLADRVEPWWAESLARSIAPIRETGGEGGEAPLPNAIRYIDLAGIDPANPDEVLARWTLGGRSTGALIGVSADGPLTLDLKRDGPHGLVAGTTGSGRSELLQTLVASLAVANRPDAMNFVLVDYKGGSAFADCERLPHTVGMVTNLDSAESERALRSLEAELARREQVLKELKAPDVDTAWDSDPVGATARQLARLVIVIDEFAELVLELPDFVTGLIRVARVGRSLGVHLLLATRRPAGVVSEEMRANTGLRIGLRMEDKDDSVQVLDAPDAAGISRSTPGRGLVRTGSGSALIPFQTARIAGRRRGESAGLPPPEAALVPWTRIGYALPARRRDEQAGAVTDLHALVDAIAAAAGKLDGAEPLSPWLPTLPTG